MAKMKGVCFSYMSYKYMPMIILKTGDNKQVIILSFKFLT